MSSFLELCQRTAQESGAVSGEGQPSSVVAQTGVLKEIVDWVSLAWVRIQNERNAWRFMRQEFASTATTIGSARYTASSWGLTTHAEWLAESEDDYNIYTIYKQSIGVVDERPLEYIDWPIWRNRYGRGLQVNNYPCYYTISPANEFCLGPLPDAAYIVRGEFRRAPQVLLNNSDVPICPARFHEVIVWRAVLMLAEEAEAIEVQVPSAARNYREILAQMERDQLPRRRITSNPIA